MVKYRFAGHGAIIQCIDRCYRIYGCVSAKCNPLFNLTFRSVPAIQTAEVPLLPEQMSGSGSVAAISATAFDTGAANAIGGNRIEHRSTLRLQRARQTVEHLFFGSAGAIFGQNRQRNRLLRLRCGVKSRGALRLSARCRRRYSPEAVRKVYLHHRSETLYVRPGVPLCVCFLSRNFVRTCS